MSTATEDRFLYHSFPRRDRDSAVEINNGCKVLSLIRDVGLVLTPEAVKWEYSHTDGSPARKQEIWQKRVCFTELSPSELPRHAENFGHFALEFRIDILKGLGAIPVFYIPQSSSAAGTPTELGSIVVMQSIDATALVANIANVKHALDAASSVTTGRMDWTFGSSIRKSFSLDVAETRRAIEAITYGLTPPDMLFYGLEGLLSYFYPADDVGHDDALRYYRQREWRIAKNFAIKGEKVMHQPSPELVDRILDVDAAFWGDEFPRGSGSKSRRVDQLLIYPGISKRIIEVVNRVIVPPNAVDRARDILKDLAQPPPVVSLASI